MQHVVEHDDAAGREHGCRQLEIARQRVPGMLAVDVEEAHLLAVELGQQVVGLHRAAVGLPCDAPGFADAVLGAVGVEAVDHFRVGPVEEIDAQSFFAVRQRMRHRDEEAPLERSDFGNGSGDALLRLNAQQAARDGRREARRHADHAGVAPVEIGIDGGNAGDGIIRVSHRVTGVLALRAQRSA